MDKIKTVFNISSQIHYDYSTRAYLKKEKSIRDFAELQPEMIRVNLVNTPQITFEVTDACNLECKYCGYGAYYNFYDKRESKILDQVKAIRFLEYMIGLWDTEMNSSADQNVYISFYGGEPLLNMPFIKGIVDYLKQHKSPNRHFTFSMTTNAMLLDRYVDYLKEEAFHLLISLDGNESNNSYRVDKNGKGVFERITKNIEGLRSKYPTYFEEKVSFNAVLHNRNSVEKIHHFFKENYGKTPSIGELNNSGIRPDMVEEFKSTYRNTNESLHQSENYEAIEKEMFLILGRYQSLGFFIKQFSGSCYNDYLNLLFEQKSTSRIPTGTCLPFGKKVFITVNGKILPCERIGHQFALGTISDNVVNLDFKAIAQRYNRYFAKVKKQCSTCHNLEGCMQCIFYLEDIENKPTCHGHMSEKQFSDYAAHHIDYLRGNPGDYYRIMDEFVIE